MPSPERVPPYQVMIVDALGFLWIGEYVLPLTLWTLRRLLRM